MYTLKSIAQRGTTLGAAMALAIGAVVPTILPATTAYADALNPLTERSLTLSSSSPGWSFGDGSNNSTYAPPNSGANGQKTGNYYSFKVSTNSTNTGTNEPVKAFTFQYCTTAAGDCLAPGDNDFDDPDSDNQTSNSTRNPNTSTTSDLNIVVSSPEEIGDEDANGDAGDFAKVVDSANGDLKAVPGFSTGLAGRESELHGAAEDVPGNYVVYYESGGTWVQSTGWVMTASSLQHYGGEAKTPGTVGSETSTGRNNLITLTNTTGQGFLSGTPVKVLFFANDTNYITNPGSKEFYVRINTYKSDSVLTDANIIDGGVTVANIMNQSIWIQTKVLETMDFSVGTVNPDTLSGAQLNASEKASATHGICDRILTRMTAADPANVLKMGDPLGEYSLRTDTTFSTHSYWRLSSNSSAGATVYYSGSTLTNTSGDKIDPIGPAATAPTIGSEQFGLAIAHRGVGTAPDGYLVDYTMERDSAKVYEQGADNLANGLVDPVINHDGDIEDDPEPGDTNHDADYPEGVDASWISVVNASKHKNRLYPLAPEADYTAGAGVINADYGVINTAFAFDDHSNEVPVAIAQESSQVVDCVTAKMRYIANIAATTPAGIYTTKVNYIAAPQY